MRNQYLQEAMDHYLAELSKTGISLREHQKSGVKKLLNWYSEGHGGILADEMGLGKTCQAVATMALIIDKSQHDPFLVICPLSVIEHWENEIKRFGIGKLKVVKYIGDAESRAKLRENLQKTQDWNVLLTTYQVMLKDEMYLNWSWAALFFDEAQRIKSSSSLLHKVIREKSIDWTMLLTGTPIQNNLRELYALLCLLDKSAFPFEMEEEFTTKHRDTEDENVIKSIHSLLNKYMIRRTIDVVGLEIPSSTEVIIYHGITVLQRDLYRAILSRNYRFFENFGEKSESSASKMSLLNVLMQLRKCTAHPYLFEGVEPEPFVEGDHLITASGKFSILNGLLGFLYEKGHRVLIFSQMTRLLDIVQDYLSYKGYQYERLDGSARAEERFSAISQFQNKRDAFCFLLSTRAGGVGINLTAADTVIFLDSDFNPQNDIQSAARCLRIGQTKPVKVIRLLAQHTVEEMVYRRASSKLRMTRRVLGVPDDFKHDLTAAEISDLIVEGLDRLSTQDAEKSIEKDCNNAIAKLLGESGEKGLWKDVGKMSGTSSEKTTQDTVEDMYVFEGRDYRRDREILQDIVSNGKKEAEKTVGLEQKKRRVIPLTEEEAKRRKEEMQKRRLEAEERRKIETEKRKKEREERKFAKWKSQGYTSTALTETLEDDDEIIGGHFGPHFVYGDVTHPKMKSVDNSETVIIAHVADNSGSFGRGGVFNALRTKSQRIVEVYEMAAKMDDLHIGDAHLIENVTDVPAVDSKQDPSENQGTSNAMSTDAQYEEGKSISRKECVILLIAQKRQSRDVIIYKDLETCFSRLAAYAVKNNARSVHLPRIGYGMQNISWYAIERLIRKSLCSRGIHTYIYYYRKNRPQGAPGTSAVPHRKRPNRNPLMTVPKKSKKDDSEEEEEAEFSEEEFEFDEEYNTESEEDEISEEDSAEDN